MIFSYELFGARNESNDRDESGIDLCIDILPYANFLLYSQAVAQEKKTNRVLKYLWRRSRFGAHFQFDRRLTSARTILMCGWALPDIITDEIKRCCWARCQCFHVSALFPRVPNLRERRRRWRWYQDTSNERKLCHTEDRRIAPGAFDQI